MARQLPFDEESFPALYARIKAGYFKIHQQFSDNLKDLIIRMLTVNPIQRITLQQIYSHPWLKLFPYYDLCISQTKNIIKIYENKGICKKIIKNILQYQEFRNLSIENAENIIQNRRESTNFTEGDNLSTTYNILMDIEIQIQKDMMNSLQFSKTPVMKKIPLQNISEKTTAGSSCAGNIEDKSIPYNWVYGFRSNLQYCYLSVKLFESFKEIGLCWKIQSKRIILKGKNIKLLVIIYKFEASIVIDCTLKKGSGMIFFEIVNMIYSIIYKNTHINGINFP